MGKHINNCHMHIGQTGNGSFWVAIPKIMQKVAIHLQLLDCDNKARAGIMFGKMYWIK